MEHQWWIWNGLECCKVCGMVRRNDDKNKPCRGPVKVEPRIEAIGPPPKESE
jgi:hypothetical protein